MSADTINIRLQMTRVSNPPVSPLDIETGLAPQAWRGAGLGVDLALFAPNGSAVDLSDLDFLEVDIYPAAVLNIQPGTNFSYNPYSGLPFPNTPPAPQLFFTVDSEDITSDIGMDEWQAGNAQQASVYFSFIQMQSLDLGGQQSKDFWLVVSGKMSSGRRIIYGGTRLTVWESGAQDIYLPNNLPPLLVPDQTIYYIPPNQQVVFSQTIEVDGLIVDEGFLVQA